MARSHFTVTFGAFASLSALSLGLFAPIGCGSTGKVSPGADGDTGTTCDVSACGPALGMPAITCADGSLGGNTGRCLATSAGTCGWEIRTCPSADASIDATGDVTSDVASDAPPADATACFDASGTVPSAMRACKVTSDCVVDEHQTDCCGTTIFTGIAKTSQAAFEACEKPWVEHFPGCGCAGRFLADDGKMISDTGKVGLDCIADASTGLGTCRTTSCVAGQMCTSGGSCSTGCGGISCACNATTGVYECHPNLC